MRSHLMILIVQSLIQPIENLSNARFFLGFNSNLVSSDDFQDVIWFLSKHWLGFKMSDQNNEGEKDTIPMLSKNIELKRFTMRSASMPIQSDKTFLMNPSVVPHTGPLQTQTPPLESFKRKENLPTPFPHVNHTNNISSTSVKKKVHSLKWGLFKRCDILDCPECLAAYKKSRKINFYRYYAHLDRKLHNIRWSDVHGWSKQLLANVLSYFPIRMPDSKVVQQWNKFFVISCLVAIFIDPLFFILLSVEKTNKCMVLNWSLGRAIAVVRSITDIIYLLHMLLQFRLAYVAPHSGTVWGGQLVKEHRKVALHYLRGYFIFDLFLVLPLPQVMSLVVIPKYIGSSAEKHVKNMLPTTVLLQLLQYLPRMFRFLPLLGGKSASGFIFESSWANFVVNLLMFVLAGHVVGSAWYLFGLQRVSQCLHDTCASFNKTLCSLLIVCVPGGDIDNFSQQFRQHWRDYDKSSNCLDSTSDQFSYGIYQPAVPLTTKNSVITRYIYSLFWGFQQISTLAGNQTPSYFVWEILFTMAIVGLGLLLFALLIGNLQNFLQAPERRRMKMQQKQRDLEQWMRNRYLPEVLRERVREAERFSWITTRGVNEEELLSNLPDDLQRDIRRHFFRFRNKVRILTLLEYPILDAICDNLRRKLYPSGSILLSQGETIEKIAFIVKGKLESTWADGHVTLLENGDAFGEELITWYLEQHPLGHYKEEGKNRYQGSRLFSTRVVRCLTNVEVLVLRADVLEQIIRDLVAIRYLSPYWRERAAKVIQVAWIHRKRRLIAQRNTR
ncbi:putative cyclic nucleotide-gated ion channel 20 [Carex littledalei]|uniref:Putative cyclic nucleotide-gated ion channel 20 n=1 Tax=Carex littledalei TaxID=544730 RepID=A0A833RH51_9POAL|nr:putative cyclic nucleotide-gated ion channel 20 [Carex littledalei]